MNLDNKIPPPLVALFFAGAMWLAQPDTQHAITAVHITGIVVCWLIGTVFSVAALVAFRRAKTTVNPLKPQAASSLVVSGVFRFSRNPMYVGMAFVLLAWAIYLGSVLSLLGVVGFVLFITRYQIIPEESAMRALFGEAFTRYTQTVRRWL